MEVEFGFARPSGPAIGEASKNDASTTVNTIQSAALPLMIVERVKRFVMWMMMSLFFLIEDETGTSVVRLCACPRHGVLYAGYVITAQTNLNQPGKNCTQMVR